MTQTVVTTSQTWRLVKLGGGGFLTKLDIANDGTLYASCDTYGGYILRPPYTGEWIQWKTAYTQPSRMVEFAWKDTPTSIGTYETRVDKTNSDIAWSVNSNVPIKTVDGGLTWVEKSNGFPDPASSQMDANNSGERTGRIMGPFMAVDPHNSNVVYLGNGHFLWRTIDGGDNWAACTGILEATNENPGITSVMVDPSSPLVGSGATERRSRVICWSHGRGWYHSLDGGDSFSLMGIGGPGYPDDPLATPDGGDGTRTVPRWSTMLANGIVLCAPRASNDAIIWRLKNGVWYEDGPVNYFYPVGDAFDSDRVVAQNSYEGFRECLDITAEPPVWSDIIPKTMVPDPDMEWLTYGTEMQSGVDNAIVEMVSSPIEEDIFWAVGGTGVWRIYLPRNADANDVTVTPITKGIENMVGIQIRKFAGNPNVYMSCYDRGCFISANPEAYASRASTPWLGEASQGFPLRWGADFASPNFVQSKMVTCQMGQGDPYVHSCGLSYDEGDTWEKLKLPNFYGYMPREFNTIQATSGSPTLQIACNLGGFPQVGMRITFTRMTPFGNIDLNNKSYIIATVGPNSWDFTITYEINSNTTTTGAGGNFEFTKYHDTNKISTVDGSDTVTAELTGEREWLHEGGKVYFTNVATIGGLNINGWQTLLTDGRSNGIVTFKPGGTANATVTNGGGTNYAYFAGWTVGQTPPATHMAMSTEDNWMIMGGGGRVPPFWTKDKGVTWAKSAGLESLDDAGWSWTYNQWRDTLVSDPNVEGHFYVFHQDNRTLATGVYRSTDGGENFVYRGGSGFQSHSNGTWHTQLRTVPGHAGHLFWCVGMVGNYSHQAEGGKALFSTDGGATWNFIGATLGAGAPADTEIGAVMFLTIGGVKPGSSYPTIWMMANLNGTDEAAFGIYYCTNADPLTTGNWTWNRVEKYPEGWMDQTLTMWADPEKWHTCFMSLAGSGYKYTTQDDVTKRTFRITT
jgi:hypothetical protein